MPRGGYQKPSNPAPVSGPGALSRRTDGGPTQAPRYMSGGKYGEGSALMDQQSSAPMAAAQRAPISTSRAAMQGSEPITPLSAPTQYPEEPLSTGMPFDPRTPGKEILASRNTANSLSSTLMQIAPFDETGELTELANYLVMRGL